MVEFIIYPEDFEICEIYVNDVSPKSLSYIFQGTRDLTYATRKSIIF